MDEKGKTFFEKLENNVIVQSIRQGMILSLPAVMAGSLALLIREMPISSYQSVLRALFQGAVYDALSLINNATLGLIGLILLCTISLSYGRAVKNRATNLFPIVSLSSYIVITSGIDLHFDYQIFQSEWLFNAIVISVLCSWLFDFLCRKIGEKQISYADGADTIFNTTVSVIFPGIIVIFFFAVLHFVIIGLFQGANLQLLFSNIFFVAFQHMGRTLLSGLLFIVSLHILWFFGIHGGNVLNNVAINVFSSGIEVNQALLEAGKAPTEIFTKSFFDTFVLMGGCGTILCLILAIFINDKRKNVRELAKMAVIPAFFNINEMVIFGLPVVFNFYYIIPFLLTPIVLTIVSYFAVLLGIVPIVTQTVSWTIPFIISGYAATGSISGSVLQIANILIGIFIYIPFVKKAQKHDKEIMESNLKKLTEIVMEAEGVGTRPELIGRSDKLAFTAKALAVEFLHSIKMKEIELFYQPQVNSIGEIVGIEALLRYKGLSSQVPLYPPLLIALAEEAGFGNELGFAVIEKAFSDFKYIENMAPKGMELSVNLTSEQLKDIKIADKIYALMKKHNIKPNSLGLELTEQTALESSQIMLERLDSIRKLGVHIIMDDFGMGHSSLMYLRNGQFDFVKLDGVLVKDILGNARCRDIISSIVQLSTSLGFEVIAEYVETKEQEKILESLGCFNYQGYLYSKAVPLKELIDFFKKNEQSII